MRWLSLVALSMVGCDDTPFTATQREYSADWLGVQVFFYDHCIRCHPAIAPAIDLPEDIFGDVCGEFDTWVVPNDSEASMLWRVVSGERREDDPAAMPFGNGPLPLEQVEFIRTWIDNGAVIEECP